jgi:hypothetical protein
VLTGAGRLSDGWSEGIRAEVCGYEPSGRVAAMGIGSSIFLIAVGAILYFAVNATVSGLEISTIGLILMLCGVLGLLISLFFLGSLRRRPAERTVVNEREPYV